VTAAPPATAAGATATPAAGPGPDSANGRGTGGGLAARRAVVRWAWRLLRREWRQQVLVVALLTFAVAAAVGGSAAMHGTVPRSDDILGSAERRIFLSRTPAEAGSATASADQLSVAEVVNRAEAAFGRVDAIGQRRVAVPGSVEQVELRAQDPDGPFGDPILDLVAGRYPTASGEVAVTDGVAEILGVDVGDRVDLGGPMRTVVGRVESPADLDDEFALVPPAEMEDATELSLLFDADEAQVASFAESIDQGYGGSDRGGDNPTMAGVVALAMSTVVLLLVSLIAAAGFVVIAQRRLRQLGMLAAVGATERHLRLVLLADGAVVGVLAALAGTGIGLTAWIVAAPHLEEPAGHRIDPWQVPWWLVVGGMLLAVVTALAAAWWPARAISRVPITQALSARPPRPQPVHRSVLAAVALTAIGFAVLRWAFEDQDSIDAPSVVVGVVALAVGVLLTSPTVVRGLPAVAGRLPIALRLALRDLGRHQARSGAALAAISLGLGIPVATVVIASAVEYQSDVDAGPGNLADDQLLLHVGDPPELVPDLDAAAVERMQDVVDGLAETLDGATVVPLDAAIDPREGSLPGFGDGSGGRPSDLLAEPVGDESFHGHALHVATPELLAWAGIGPASIDPDADVATSLAPRGGLVLTPDLAGARGPDDLEDAAGSLDVERIDPPEFTSLPDSLITPASLERHGLVAARTAWLVDAAEPFTDAQLDEARDAAAAAGLYLESRRAPASTATLRTVATGIGLLIALGILAMTVGLLRSEATGDLRTLTATGASSRVRRAITAATAAALALLGAALGTAGAYAAVVAGYSHDLAPLGRVPVVHLLVILVGLPLAAATAGWVLAGREPPSLTRHPT
jgi:putative ABC transport system permease protein